MVERFTASSITDDALDELYAERELLAQVVATLTGLRPDEALGFAREALVVEAEVASGPVSPVAVPDAPEPHSTVHKPSQARDRKSVV